MNLTCTVLRFSLKKSQPQKFKANKVPLMPFFGHSSGWCCQKSNLPTNAVAFIVYLTFILTQELKHLIDRTLCVNRCLKFPI